MSTKKCRFLVVQSLFCSRSSERLWCVRPENIENGWRFISRPSSWTSKRDKIWVRNQCSSRTVSFHRPKIELAAARNVQCTMFTFSGILDNISDLQSFCSRKSGSRLLSLASQPFEYNSNAMWEIAGRSRFPWYFGFEGSWIMKIILISSVFYKIKTLPVYASESAHAFLAFYLRNIYDSECGLQIFSKNLREHNV